MKSLPFMVFFLTLCFLGGSAFADDQQGMLAVAKEIVAEDKARFGIDIKKCRLECERVYSKDHCVAKCRDLASQLRLETYAREEAERKAMEAEKPLKYKDVAEKYR
ncbi:MAG: hypothetical protein V1882_09535 [Candidatus Omnitrophota bacterium]